MVYPLIYTANLVHRRIHGKCLHSRPPCHGRPVCEYTCTTRNCSMCDMHAVYVCTHAYCTCSYREARLEYRPGVN